jgi:hypothetical protein
MANIPLAGRFALATKRRLSVPTAIVWNYTGMVSPIPSLSSYLRRLDDREPRPLDSVETLAQESAQHK